ncbi:MAG: TIGR04282 family arsenosugar biosynthesis glycosyltransferase [Deltaproteobacteria bacterium]|nr:TIGR04282 family arsenosugar biosynthesis glycosyltransferase [Deltaproteobacteria bacterium]
MALKTLLLFTKYPTPGFVKTRLIPLLGIEASTHLHEKLTEMIVNKVVIAQAKSEFALEIHFHGANYIQMLDWLGPGLLYRQQIDGNLGDKMSIAFKNAFDQGSSKVVVVGSDAPDITPDILIQAFDLLDNSDVVIGPAFDGGYYLLGSRAYYPSFFENIEWGSSSVLNQTIERITCLSLTKVLLPLLSDLDRPEDLIEHQNRLPFSCVFKN